MTTIQTSLRDLVVGARDMLPARKRRRLDRRLARRGQWESVADDLLDHLHGNETCCEMGLQPVFASQALGVDTKFSIDPEKLDALLEVVFKWLLVFLEDILPILLIGNGQSGYEGPLPATEADDFTLGANLK